MKKIFTKLMLLAVAAAALVSCENKFEEQTPSVELTQTVTLSAEKPTEVRTELIEGVPYWSKDDQIGVYVQDGDTYKNYAFKNDNEEATLTTTFTGTTAVANTLYVYYPYVAGSDVINDKGVVKATIPSIQQPTIASFDGAADIMIAKPVTLDEAGKQVSDLEFARLGAIVKIALKDNTGKLAGQHIQSLTMTAESNLVGKVYLDAINQELGELYYGGSKSVTATYTESTQFEVNEFDDNENKAVYLVVYPQTLAAGSKLTIEASTEGYAISKEITLPEDIILPMGTAKGLRVSLAAENVVAEATGLALPVEDDFSWITSDNESGAIDTSLNGDLYSSGSKVYPLNSANTGKGVKFGSSSVAGSITTVDLNLSQPFSVIFDAKKYGSDASKLQVTAGDQVLATATLVDAWTTYVLEFEAVDAKEQITIEVISDTRAYLDNLKVVAGHDYVLPPVLTVSTAEISGVSHEGEAKTFTYSVANPVDGVSATVTEDVDWITIADNNGTVTVTVAANEVEEAREGVITVTYGDLTETVTVQQNAKPAAGGDVTVTECFEKVTSAPSDWSGTYLIVYETGKVAFDGSLATLDAVSNTKTVTISDNQIEATAEMKAIAFTIAKSGTNYTIKSASGKYIGNNGDSNALTTSTTAMNNTLAFVSANDITIKASGGSFLRYNATSGQTRFRYFKSGTYTSQKAIQLYKLVGESGGEGGETPEPTTPVLSVSPATLSFDAAGGSKTVTCTIENEVSGVNVTATENVDWLSASVSGKTVTITATENTGAERTANVTIAYTGAESKTVTVSQAAGNTGGGDEPEQGSTHFVKVTSAPSDWSGTYLIVYEGENFAFDGSLSTLEASNNYKTVIIADNKIEATDEMKAITFTIAKSGTSYTIKSASGFYIGNNSNSNKLYTTTNASTYTNNISLNGTDAHIVSTNSNAPVLRFNTDSGQDRFRYYKNSSYTGQKAIQLYKLN